MTTIGHYQPFNVDARKQLLDAALDPQGTVEIAESGRSGFGGLLMLA